MAAKSVSVFVIIFINLIIFFIIPKILKSGCKLKNIIFTEGFAVFAAFVFSYFIFYIQKSISVFKLLVFLVILSCVYTAGLIYDILINSKFFNKLSAELIKNLSILVISLYTYYIFNEEYWAVKGLVTALSSTAFEKSNSKPAKLLKLFYITWIILLFAKLRWTYELYIISFVVLSTYYCFNDYRYIFIGKGGTNLLGYITGLIICEALASKIIYLIFIFPVFILLNVSADGPFINNYLPEYLYFKKFFMVKEFFKIPLIKNIKEQKLFNFIKIWHILDKSKNS